MSESLVEFYRRHRISPVQQDISNLDRHFARRAALYRQLGFLPSFFTGRTVLEIGPGSGFNSLYTASLAPSRYVLVEGNPKGVADIRALFANAAEWTQNLTVVESLLEDFASTEQFDVVLCEGMLALAGVPNPRTLLDRVASYVAPEGVLVITCIDAISDFPEMVRRLFAALLTDAHDSLDARADALLGAFAPHLSTLVGMSRPHRDWIIDNLLNPASIGPYLGIADALTALAGRFEYYGGSPHFVSDWRWYKAIDRDARYTARALEQYWQQAHNLLDYRTLHGARDAADNQRLYGLCESTRDLIRTYEDTRDRAVLGDIRARLSDIAEAVSPINSDAAAATREAAALIDTATPANVAAAGKFGAWFGRGQQYLSFERVDD
jgi:2-polyprenyl-3-methyl-5-hydroxy-6-metoxy-1,4-benzoquinol methylase